MTDISRIPDDDDSRINFPENYKSMSLFEIFNDSDLMEDISDRNIELVEVISTPEKSKEIVEILLNMSNSDDLFKKYKAPYLAANCFAAFPEERMNEILKDDSFLDQVFDFIFSDSISDLYLGYFDCVFDGMVRKSSQVLYDYLSKHSNDLLSRFASHMNRLTIVNILRYLLDVPLMNDQPWWNDSQAFLNSFISYLDKEDCSSGVTLFLVSVIQRGTCFESEKTVCASSKLVPILIDSMMINTMFTIITSSTSDFVISNTLSILSRLLWKEVPELDYGLGGYDGIVDRKTIFASWKSLGVLSKEDLMSVCAQICNHVNDLMIILRTSLNKKADQRNGFADNCSIPLCPKSVIAIMDLLLYLFDVCSDDERDLIMKEGVIELMVTAVKKYYYCSILHVTVVKAFNTLLSKPNTEEFISHMVYDFINEAFDSPNYCLRHVSHELGRILASTQASSFDKLSDSVKSILTKAESIPNQDLRRSELPLPTSAFIPAIDEVGSFVKITEGTLSDDVPCDIDDIDPSDLPNMDEETIMTASIHDMDLSVSDELKFEVGDNLDLDMDMIPDNPELNSSFPPLPEENEDSPSMSDMIPPKSLLSSSGSGKERNCLLSSSIVLNDMQDDDACESFKDIIVDDDGHPIDGLDLPVNSLPFCIGSEEDPTKDDFPQLDKLPS